VRIYTRFRSTKSKPPRQSGYYWIAAAIGLAFLGWVLWHTQRSEPSEQKKVKPHSVHLTNARSSRVVPPRSIGHPSNIVVSTVSTSKLLLTVVTNRITNAVQVTSNALDASNTLEAPVLTTNATSREASNAPIQTPQAGVEVRSIFDAQVALSRAGIAPGSIDGALGSQTRAALEVFQKTHGLPVTGSLDETTRRHLTLSDPPVTNYIVTTADLGRLRPLSKTWLGKSQQDRLDYETILELVAEKGHAHPLQIRRMNPGVDWSRVSAGQVLNIPASEYPAPADKAAFLRIYLSRRVLEAFDLETNVIVHFPVSIAKRVEKRPVGQLHIQTVAPNPNYVFNPDIFPESAVAKTLGRKLVLPPGPNNPVGAVWIGLDRSGYGIHGTPSPEDVGRTESHGCFRLANWNAEFLVKLVWVGMPVWVEP
jgi:lipoprotein-anchoring transpeptidase ErfK/SrfK